MISQGGSNRRNQKGQSTLSNFLISKKPKKAGQVATQRSMISSSSNNVSKFTDSSSLTKIISLDSDDEDKSEDNADLQIIRHKVLSKSDKVIKPLKPHNFSRSFVSPVTQISHNNLKTTMNSETTEKSMKKFQKWDSIAISNKPRLVRENSTPSFTSSSQSSKSAQDAAGANQDQIVLSSEQKQVLKMVIDEGRSIFFTGSAGTGKSVLLREIIKRLQGVYYREDFVAVTASTGLAAVNIGGQTIHRFAGIGIGNGSVGELIKRVEKNELNVKRWRNIKVLIIDEISMIDGDLFSKVAAVAKHVRRNDQPFGGIQLVLTGDFFQLPPVPDKFSHRAPKYCFQSPEWNDVVEETILLTNVFRQKGDTELIDMLNTVRLGTCSIEMARKFQSLSRQVIYDDNIQPTELYPTREEVRISNSTRLNQLPGKPRCFKAVDVFSSDNPYAIKHEKSMLDNMLCVEELILKEDAQVLMLKNLDNKVVNGSVGIVSCFLTEELYLGLLHDYDFDNFNNSSTREEVRFISSCIGEQPQEEMRSKLNTFSSDARVRMKPHLLTALRSRTTDVYPVVAFSIPGSRDDGKIIKLVQTDEFSVNIPKAGSKKSGKAVRMQIPLLLSWAISIHKSQGQTLDRVKVDLNKIFEKGQVYVALSRATSKDRLQVLNFRSEKIRASDEVREFYRNLQTISN
ncbi:DNA helicase [Saccharomycopsis crataegensis]|uniref:ATP-dependent DNA helicase PIF1 n=1 Tax=Saccharomycopsis crataegensis TaxID=43959 RepID=A0AAV5QDJ4_9ASCO|nr:DNA helicase [Saccharomycopsis crataegensis]